MNSKENYGLWMMMMYQWRFVKMYHSGGVIWSRGAHACVGAGDIWEISVPSTQFCLNLNSKKSLKKERKGMKKKMSQYREFNV